MLDTVLNALNGLSPVIFTITFWSRCYHDPLPYREKPRLGRGKKCASHCTEGMQDLSGAGPPHSWVRSWALVAGWRLHKSHAQNCYSIKPMPFHPRFTDFHLMCTDLRGACANVWETCDEDKAGSWAIIVMRESPLLHLSFICLSWKHWSMRNIETEYRVEILTEQWPN